MSNIKDDDIWILYLDTDRKTFDVDPARVFYNKRAKGLLLHGLCSGTYASTVVFIRGEGAYPIMEGTRTLKIWRDLPAETHSKYLATVDLLLIRLFKQWLPLFEEAKLSFDAELFGTLPETAQQELVYDLLGGT